MSDAPYPSIAADEIFTIYAALCLDPAETDTIRSLVSKLLPPPEIGVFAEVVEILAEIELISSHEASVFGHFAERNSSHPSLTARSRRKRYPLCFAIRDLMKNGRSFPSTREKSIRTLFGCAQCHPPTVQFSGNMYYRHVIGYRDVFLEYWKEVREAQQRGDNSRQDTWEDVLEFIEERPGRELTTEHQKTKFVITSHLIDGSFLLGGVWPRGEIAKRRHCRIGSQLSVSEALHKEADATVFVQSAVVAEPLVEDAGLSAEIQYPDGATTRDKQKINRVALAGFSRTNVRTVADMNGLSAVTYSDYLSYAASSFPDAAYALTWIAAFAGIDVSRRLAASDDSDRMPFNEDLVLDPSISGVRYHVLRRRSGIESIEYETAGVMRLPVPARVRRGLARICEADSQDEILASCNQAARDFSQKRPGLTPTLRRLKATARILLAPKQFSELEFSAISGRVVPALKGSSAYYPHQVVPLIRKFNLAYGTVLDELGIAAPGVDELPSITDGSNDQLFCLPSPGMPTVQELMEALSSAYKSCCAQLDAKGMLASVDDVVSAVMVHETACYVMQEITLGIRPVGAVADFIAASADMGVLVKDKGSRLFSERSFSPLTQRHWQLLSCAQENRHRLCAVLACKGRGLDCEENSSLACEVRSRLSGAGLELSRMTNQFFRADAPVAATIVDRTYMPNWLRHVAAEYLQGKAVQWQLDEFFGHQRTGREPMTKWSTAGTSHFESLQAVNEDLVQNLVGSVLLMPVPTYLAGFGRKMR
jgi:hypothetical protein